MKAILVIDIGDEEIEDLAINYLLYRSSEGMVIDGDMGAVLKPMPMKKASLEKWFAEGGTYLYTYNPNDYDKGWNDCVDFLEGEENE